MGSRLEAKGIWMWWHAVSTESIRHRRNRHQISVWGFDNHSRRWVSWIIGRFVISIGIRNKIILRPYSHP
jgi:hypothetical protein